MEPHDYQTVELTQEEMANVTKDLQDILEKHNCEMQVISNIHILKRQIVEEPEKIDVIKSPYDGEKPTNNETETNATSEESSGSSSKESPKG